MLVFSILKKNKEFIKYGKNLAESRDISIFKEPRIVIQRILSLNPPRLKTNIFTKTAIVNSDLITIKSIKKEYNEYLYFFAGLISSNIFGQMLYDNNINLKRSVYPKINMKTLLTIEIPDITKIEKSLVNEVSNSVEQIIQENQEIKNNRTEKEIEISNRKIEYLLNKVNKIIFKLYEK